MAETLRMPARCKGSIKIPCLFLQAAGFSCDLEVQRHGGTHANSARLLSPGQPKLAAVPFLPFHHPLKSVVMRIQVFDERFLLNSALRLHAVG